MSVLILCYENDFPGKEMFKAILGNDLARHGYRTEMGEVNRRTFGQVVSGWARAGSHRRTFTCAILNRDIGALGVAAKLRYHSGNSVLIASALSEQIDVTRRRVQETGAEGGLSELGGILYSQEAGYAVFDRKEVPNLSEWFNAILVTGEIAPRELAALALRHFVFSEVFNRRAVTVGPAHPDACVELAV